MKLSKHLFLLLLLLPVSAFAVKPIQLYPVKEVLNGKSFVLDSGDTVRLASLQVPNIEEKTGKKRPGEPLGTEARSMLASLVSGKKLSLKTGKIPRDRKNRIVAQAYFENGESVQEAMLRSGLAMVYPIFEDTSKADLQKMLAAESEARAAKKGIWANPEYKILSPEEAGSAIDKFRIVRGIPLDIQARRGNIYINFGKDWNRDFTIYLPKRYARSFEDSGIENMAGKTIEVRGWIEEKGGPMIELIRPEQLTVPE